MPPLAAARQTQWTASPSTTAPHGGYVRACVRSCVWAWLCACMCALFGPPPSPTHHTCLTTHHRSHVSMRAPRVYGLAIHAHEHVHATPSTHTLESMQPCYLTHPAAAPLPPPPSTQDSGHRTGTGQRWQSLRGGALSDDTLRGMISAQVGGGGACVHGGVRAYPASVIPYVSLVWTGWVALHPNPAAPSAPRYTTCPAGTLSICHDPAPGSRLLDIE